jgi:hypothetical protein
MCVHAAGLYGPPQFTQEDVENCLKSFLLGTAEDRKQEEAEEREVKMKKEEQEEEEEDVVEKNRQQAHCQTSGCSLCKVSCDNFYYFSLF